MYNADRRSQEFIQGVHSFLRVAEGNKHDGFMCCPHYYTNDYAQRCTFTLRVGHLFVSAAVNLSIYRGGHFLFTVAGTFARHGKSIYRGEHLKTPAMKKKYFPWRAY